MILVNFLKDFSQELPVDVLFVNKAIRWIDCSYNGGMVRREFRRGVDLDISRRDIFDYEKVK